MIRFSLKFLFLLMGVACVVFAAFDKWKDMQDDALMADYDVVESGRIDLHEWQTRINLGPISTSSERITKLQFNTNLHYLPTEEITYYNQLEYVDTIVVMDNSPLFSSRVLHALGTYPRLKTVITPPLSKQPYREDIHKCSNYVDIRINSSFEFRF